MSRNRRIAELRRMQEKAKFGEVIEITAQSWKKQVNEAGEDIVVIVHLYSHSYVFNKKFVSQKYLYQQPLLKIGII